MLMTQAIAAQRHDASKRNLELLARGRDARDEPGYFAGVREGEDKFVDDAVNADCAGDEGEGGVWGVGEDEVVGVEGG